MGLNLLYAEPPEIKNVNVRKEGSGDDAPVAVDVKISGIAHHSDYQLVSKITGCNAAQAKAFWTESGEPVFVGVDLMPSIVTFDEGQHCEIGEQDFKSIRVRGISFKPIGSGMVRLSLTVQIPNIDHDLIADIAEMIKTRQKSVLYADKDLFDDLEGMSVEEAVEADIGEDALYQNAVDYVRENNIATVARLQQGLGIAYNRASKMISTLEINGIVSPMKDDGTREVIFDDQEEQSDIEDTE